MRVSKGLLGLSRGVPGGIFKTGGRECQVIDDVLGIEALQSVARVESDPGGFTSKVRMPFQFNGLTGRGSVSHTFPLPTQSQGSKPFLLLFSLMDGTVTPVLPPPYNKEMRTGGGSDSVRFSLSFPPFPPRLCTLSLPLLVYTQKPCRRRCPRRPSRPSSSRPLIGCARTSSAP